MTKALEWYPKEYTNRIYRYVSQKADIPTFDEFKRIGFPVPVSGLYVFQEYLRHIELQLNDALLGLGDVKMPLSLWSVIYKVGFHKKTHLGFTIEVNESYAALVKGFWEPTKIHNDHFSVSIGFPDNGSEQSHLLAIFCLLHIRRLSCWLAETVTPAISVNFAMEEPSYVDELEYLFQAPLKFGAERNDIFYPTNLGSTEIERDLSELGAYLERMPFGYGPDGDTIFFFTGKIKNLLTSTLQKNGQLYSLDQIEDALNMGKHTIAANLKKEGTSYQKIKDEVRQEMAIKKLKFTDLSVNQIGKMLGYFEVNSFFRAFKKWHNMTPSEFRDRANQYRE